MANKNVCVLCLQKVRGIFVYGIKELQSVG